MQLTGPASYGPPRDHAQALRVLRRAPELGIDFIDTADAYGPGIAEDLVAEALFPYPPGLVIATKGGITRPSQGQFVPDGRPAYLRSALEASLRRLRLERVDLYQLHRVDPRVPLAESVGALAELRAEGLIRHIGLSQVGVRQLEEARRAAPIVSVQNRYNLIDRDGEDVLAYCGREGIAFIPWFPLATGELARPGGLLGTVAARHHASPPQVALAWLLARSPVMLPIPGTSSAEHLEQNVAGAALTLKDDELRALTGA